ncbi:MAG: hypothetical protein DSO07_07460 [Thermoproteota archaeon]|jgi:hypothetical protein|uniref:Uncharacterized protein n=1 Tax=Candidatus Methanodesulfokora washburnensis TaxID=2478471 RepID=A0A429GGD9_9CREN|nr:hypothetical protein [Candidatus Methanodesulfokores washburnensis]RSN72852.1 hypothetical protein D6D85_12465 [Candidatus Methanodesulfokores washburnensis]RZN63733.1 MAG: hypothetical protein EF810_00075 [Candidatus Methanodesulfokores washburnensis]TDA40865.1 MAG: hypothetical protein DSO07_07460 [Candidatus Korarchaeota archaeon]
MQEEEKWAIKNVMEVMKRLSCIKGVSDIILLPDELKRKILELEVCEESDPKNFFRRYNAGVREVLKRDYVLVALTNEEYVYPPEPIELICFGETVGMELRDKSMVEKYRNDENVILLGDSFVIFKDKLPFDSTKRALVGEIKLFIPPMSVGIEPPEGVYGLVLGMPSSNACEFLKNWLKEKGVDVSNKNLGLILVGFNLLLKC